MDKAALEVEIGVDSLIESVRHLTKSSVERLSAMAWALDHVDRQGIDGDVVECGVWRAGNIVMARKLSPDRTCWLYDTFDGMTEPEPVDVSTGGRSGMLSYLGKSKPGGKWSRVTVEEVRENLRSFEVLDDAMLRFVEGPVEETLKDPANLPEKIALLRLDTDWYRSTKIEMDVLYPRLQTGGVLIVDDYGHWVGARKAVDEYFASHGLEPELRKIDYTAVMMVK